MHLCKKFFLSHICIYLNFNRTRAFLRICLHLEVLDSSTFLLLAELFLTESEVKWSCIHHQTFFSQPSNVASVGKQNAFRVLFLRVNPFWVVFNKQMRTSFVTSRQMHLLCNISPQKLEFYLEATKETVCYNMHIILRMSRKKSIFFSIECRQLEFGHSCNPQVKKLILRILFHILNIEN